MNHNPSPLVSIVLTTYQRPEKLDRCIRSILNQSFKDFELIIVDDHSLDDTDKVVEKYQTKDQRIRYIKLKENFGTHTRPKNEGTKAAKADYVAYFDDDNVMYPSHMQVLWKYITETKNDVVYGDSILIDDSGKGLPQLAVVSDINDPKGINIYERNFIDTNQVIVRKKWLEKIGGWDESMPRYADWNLFVRLHKAGASFFHVPILITEYHVHQGSNQIKYQGFEFDRIGCPVWPEKTLYGKRPVPKVAVFTMTKDRLDYTKRCFKALHEKTKVPFDHFVVDNGSTDGTVEWLKEQQNLKKVIYNPQNVGISKGSNQALDAIYQEANYDLIIKVDNDIEMWNNLWLEQVLDLWFRFPKVVFSPFIEGLIDSPGGAMNKGYLQIGMHLFGMTNHVGGAFCVAPRKLYDTFRWQENDYLHSNQDWVFSQYVQKSGYTLGYMQNLRAEHIDTTSGQKALYPDYFKLREKERTTRYGVTN